MRFLRAHGSAGHWLRFVLFDVASLPLLLVLRAPRGEGRAVLAKAKGILDGLRGRHVTADAIESGGGWLW